MLQQPEDRITAVIAVRDGQLAAVTCVSCGCRLQSTGAGDGSWRHYGAIGGRDARGCRPSCVDLGHDAAGRIAHLA
jgi:hypothetical protein